VKTLGISFMAALALIAAGAGSASALKTCVSPGETLFVKAKVTSMREGPGPKDNLITTLAKRAGVMALGGGCPTKTGNMYWYDVEAGPFTGWVSGGALKL
jgi:hypothetical protein